MTPGQAVPSPTGVQSRRTQQRQRGGSDRSRQEAGDKAACNSGPGSIQETGLTYIRLKSTQESSLDPAQTYLQYNLGGGSWLRLGLKWSPPAQWAAVGGGPFSAPRALIPSLAPLGS